MFRIGLGTYRSFDVPLGSPEADQCSLVLKGFHAAGGRFIDSSPMYGRSEATVGALSTQLGINGELFLATKVWTHGNSAGQAQMKESLARLGRKDKRLELMQVHNLVDWKAHWPLLEAWKGRGVF